MAKMKITVLGVICLLLPGVLLGCGGASQPEAGAPATVSLADQAPATPPTPVETEWRRDFTVDTTQLTNEGENPYFPLQAGRVLVYTGVADGVRVSLTVTVTDRTELVDGVVTRVVEEREAKNGKLAEVARNYFALDPVARDLYYFGEDVDIYENGRITRHDGSWRSGVAGARFGLLLPGNPHIGDRYHQEVAPTVALDRAEVVALTDTLVTPAGYYTGCLRTAETSGLNPDERGVKVYAPGIGLVRDNMLLLKSVAH